MLEDGEVGLLWRTLIETIQMYHGDDVIISSVVVNHGVCQNLAHLHLKARMDRPTFEVVWGQNDGWLRRQVIGKANRKEHKQHKDNAKQQWRLQQQQQHAGDESGDGGGIGGTGSGGQGGEVCRCEGGEVPQEVGRRKDERR